MKITKDNKIFLSNDFQQDKYKFNIIIENLSSPTLELYSDEKNYIVCRGALERPICIWTKDNFDHNCLFKIENTLTKMLVNTSKTELMSKEELYSLLKNNNYSYLNNDYLEIGFMICYKIKKPTKCDGKCEKATSQDKDILARYWYYNHIEARNTENITLDESTSFVEKLLNDSTIYVWKNEKKAITTIAYYQIYENQAKICGVYTHPEYRHNGYAENLVYYLTNEIINKGYIPLLYTDYKYIPSNKTYMNIGYEQLGKLIKFSCSKK